MKNFQLSNIRFYSLKAPRYWRDITAPFGFVSPAQRRDWLLVLSSKNIPWRIIKTRGIEHLYVPPLYECIAEIELKDYLEENLIKPAKSPNFPAHAFALLSILILLPLIVWHGLRKGFFQPPLWLPPPDSWLALGDMDKIRLFLYHEYYRAATALTLHADASHLTGNIFFGAIFLFILARLIGPGRAVMLAVFGGVLGNFLSALVHKAAYVSIGFSTALFASVGALGGVMIQRSYEKRRFLLVSGGVIGLLAMLGADGEHTDYTAHICGLCSGALLGLYEGWRGKKRPGRKAQLWPGLCALLVLFIGWAAAFARV